MLNVISDQAACACTGLKSSLPRCKLFSSTSLLSSSSLFSILFRRLVKYIQAMKILRVIGTASPKKRPSSGRMTTPMPCCHSIIGITNMVARKVAGRKAIVSTDRVCMEKHSFPAATANRLESWAREIAAVASCLAMRLDSWRQLASLLITLKCFIVAGTYDRLLNFYPLLKIHNVFLSHY